MVHAYLFKCIFIYRMREPKGGPYESPIEVIILSVVPVAHATFEGAQADAFLTRPHPKVIHSYVTSEYVKGIGVGRGDGFHDELLAMGAEKKGKALGKEQTFAYMVFKAGK